MKFYDYLSSSEFNIWGESGRAVDPTVASILPELWLTMITGKGSEEKQGKVHVCRVQ